MILLSAESVFIGVAVWQLGAFKVETTHLNDMTRNTTWAVHFNGRKVDAVTLEASAVPYNKYMDLYSFPHLPPLDFRQAYHQAIGHKPIFYNTFYHQKFYLNAGSSMNTSFSFCSNGSGLHVLVVQYDGDINDLLVDQLDQKSVKKSVKLPYNGQGYGCQNESIGFYSADSAAYQFVFQPWNHPSDIDLREFEFNGNMTQYNVETGATDYCNMSSDATQCSVDLNQNTATVVVIRLGNFPFPTEGTNVISCSLTPTTRRDYEGIFVGSVLGIAFFVTLLVFFKYLHHICCYRKGRST